VNVGMRVGNVDINPIPRHYLTTLNQRDPAVDAFLSAQVPNPFKGLLPGTSLNGATIERQQLLRAFPQFTSVVSERYDGRAVYNSSQLRLERRFADRYSVSAGYTFSRLTEEVSLLNPTDTSLEHRVARDDYPHRLVVSGIYDLPFGLQIQGIYQYQSGHPLVWGNVAFFGDANTLSTDISGSTVSTPADPDRVVFDTSGFYSPGVDIRLRNNIRTFPSTLSGFRSQSISQIDLSLIKNIALAQGRLQLRVEVLNATNRPQFGEPNLDPTSSNFGRVTSQVNLPRNVQLGLRWTF
jgi:hypothetical protein